MAIELASGYVSLSVKLDGATKGLGKYFDSASKQAGAAGKSAGSAYTSALEKEVATAEAQVKKVSEAVIKLRDKEADAAGKLKVATEKLNEAREKGVSGSKLTALETARESALRRQAAAARDVAREVDALSRSQDRAARAQANLDSGSGPNRKGILSRFSITGRDSGRAFNAAVSREMGGNALSSAGAAAGQKVKGGFLRTVGKATALAAPFVGVGAIVSKGWGRMVAIDNAQMKMKQLGLEGQNLEAVMDTVKQSVTGTAFGLGEAATGAAQALAAGVKPGADLAQHMQTIVDTAAYGQVPLEEMATIMNRAKISGKVLSEDLNMLGDRGTPVYAWLQEDLGLAGDELAKFVSDGNLKYEQLNATLQKHAQGAGQRSGETFTGALSNLSAAAGRMGEKLLTPIFKPLQSGVVWMTEAFNKIGPTVESTVGGMAERVSGFVSGSLVPAVQSLMPTIQAMLPVLLDIGKAVIGAFGDAVGFVVKFKDFLIPLVAGLAAYKTAVLVIGAVTKAWAAMQAVLNVALTANPIGLIIGAVAALVAGLVLAYNKSETFRNIVNAVWNGIKTAIGAVWNWIKDTLVPGLKSAWDGIASAAQWLWHSVIEPVWNGIKSAIEIAWGIIQGIFKLWKFGFELLGAIVKLFYDNVIKPVWDSICGAIGTAWQWLSDNVFDKFKLAWDAVGAAATWFWQNVVVPVWDGIKSAFQSAWDFMSPIFDKIKSGWETLKNGVTGAATAIKDGITSAFNGLAGIIKAPLKALGGFLQGIPDKVLGVEIPFVGTLKSWGNTLAGLREGGAIRDRKGKLSGPGTGTSDSILGVDAYGMPVVRVSAGEGVVTYDAMKRGGAGLVAALNSGWTPSAEYLRDMVYGVPAAAGGLNPGAAWLKNYIQQKWGAISDIGGYRAEDGYGEHSSGNALDIMIPSWQSADGVSLGNTVASFLAANKDTLPVYGMIWQQKSYGYGGSWGGKAMEDRGSPTQNHMDHIHVWLGNGQKGAGAASTAVPTSGLKLPGGGISSPGGFGSGGSGSGGYSVGGKTISAASRDKQLGSKRDALEKAERDNDLAKRELETAKAEGKTKAETLERKQNAIDDRDKRIEKLKSEIAELEGAEFVQGTGKGSGSGSGGGSDNPFSKLIDGFSQLAEVGKGGLLETFLPPGFDNPFEWGIPKAAGGLLNFGAGLANASGNPMLGGILGMFGAGVTGDVGGVGQALTGMLSPQGTQQTLGVGADQLSADTVDGGGFDPVTGTNTGGVTYDQSITVNNPTATDTVNSSIQASANKQLANFRGSLGTKAV